MEIKVKTAKEFSDQYVTIEIRAEHNEMVRVLADPPKKVDPRVSTYDPAEAAEVLAKNEEYHLTRIKELESELTRKTAERDQANSERDHADQQYRQSISRARNAVNEIAQRLAAERERAERAEIELARKTAGWEELSAKGREQVDRLVRAANETEALNAQVAADQLRSIAARDQLLKSATTRIRMASEILGSPEVTKARDEIVTSKGAILADAISQALHALND